jgi:hypothetical protein
MRRRTRTTLVGSALLAAAALVGPVMALPAFAADAAPARSVSSTLIDPTTYYTMNLSTTAATIQPGGQVRTTITFDASRNLHGAPVDLSVSGLPAGATATFSPAQTRVGGQATLTITAGSTSTVGTSTVTVSAIITSFGIDPIGTTAPFQLTIATP